MRVFFFGLLMGVAGLSTTSAAQASTIETTTRVYDLSGVFTVNSDMTADDVDAGLLANTGVQLDGFSTAAPGAAGAGAELLDVTVTFSNAFFAELKAISELQFPASAQATGTFLTTVSALGLSTVASTTLTASCFDDAFFACTGTTSETVSVDSSLVFSTQAELDAFLAGPVSVDVALSALFGLESGTRADAEIAVAILNGPGVQFSAVYRYDTDPSPVPLPASAWGLLAAVGALGAMRRRKWRVA